MKITHLNSATELIEVNSVKILSDPWLDDGIYYGSWFSYPPYDPKHNYLLEKIDYIYISHIHPDHFCEKTMDKMDKNIPVIILNYAEKFVFKKLERIGFKNIIELDHNKRTLLKNRVYINIIAADNCNPEICGLAFGCFFSNNNSGKTYQIDSMAVIDNEDFSLLNLNDCPYPLAKESINLIKKQYKKIDFMLVGYSGASPFPFAFDSFSNKEMEEAIYSTKTKMLNYALDFIKDINPKYYMPFAGTYILGGKNWSKNKFSPIPQLDEAKFYLDNNLIDSKIKSKCILLNSGETFDIKESSQTKEYLPIDKNELRHYIEDILSKKKYDFEFESEKKIKDLVKLIQPSFEKFERKVKEIGFLTKTKIFIKLNKSKALFIDISNVNPKYSIVSSNIKKITKPYIYFDLDNRLLYNVLKGPRYAHWNNIEIGSLLRIKREPEQYEQGIHLVLCYLHL